MGNGWIYPDGIKWTLKVHTITYKSVRSSCDHQGHLEIEISIYCLRKDSHVRTLQDRQRALQGRPGQQTDVVPILVRDVAGRIIFVLFICCSYSYLDRDTLGPIL